MIASLPGGNAQIIPGPEAEPKPPDNFIDNTVRVYKLNPDGSKGELIGTAAPFPDGWGKINPDVDPASKARGESESKGEDIVVNPSKEDLLKFWNEKESINWVSARTKLSWAEAKKMLIKAGIIDQFNAPIQQTPNPDSAQATNQEPDQGAQESKDSIANRESINQGENATHVEQKEFSWDTAWPIAQKLLADGYVQEEVTVRIGTTYSALKHKIAREKEKPVKLTDPKEIMEHLGMKWVQDIAGSALPTRMKLALIGTISCMDWPGV